MRFESDGNLPTLHPELAHADMTTLPKVDTSCTAPLIPTVNGNTVRSFSTHGHQSAAKGSSTTVSRSDIRFNLDLLIRLCGMMVRRWRLIGYFPVLYNPPPRASCSPWLTEGGLASGRRERPPTKCSCKFSAKDFTAAGVLISGEGGAGPWKPYGELKGDAKTYLIEGAVALKPDGNLLQVRRCCLAPHLRSPRKLSHSPHALFSHPINSAF
jgi:hypothetical protein